MKIEIWAYKKNLFSLAVDSIDKGVSRVGEM